MKLKAIIFRNVKPLGLSQETAEKSDANKAVA